jgi:hypothetical protein
MRPASLPVRRLTLRGKAESGRHGTGECRIVHDAAPSALPLSIMLHILVDIMAGSAELVAQEQELAFGDETRR